MQKKEKQRKKEKKQEQQQEAVNEAQQEKQKDVPSANQEDQQKEQEDTGTLKEKLASAKDEIQTIQTHLEETNDKFLRLFSEFDNYRKRVTRERIELSKTAAEGVITALLPVLDDLERASQTAREQKERETEDEGVVLIFNKFKSILKQKGVEEIPSLGEEFDTDFHDAITHMPAEHDEEKGKIMEVVQKGYMLNGKVIRHARVVVAN